MLALLGSVHCNTLRLDGLVIRRLRLTMDNRINFHASKPQIELINYLFSDQSCLNSVLEQQTSSSRLVCGDFVCSTE